jgi:two-component sensor histidine kinase
LRVAVSDNGPGVDASTIGQGLGTQIIRTLVENELSATIEWSREDSGGTVVTIDIPLRYIAAAKGVK